MKLLIFLIFSFALGSLGAQTFTATNTLSTVQFGSDLYCAVRPTVLPSLQLWCYETIVTFWDTLIFNGVIRVGQLQDMEFSKYKSGAVLHTAKFTFTPTVSTVPNFVGVDWQIAADLKMNQGQF